MVELKLKAKTLYCNMNVNFLVRKDFKFRPQAGLWVQPVVQNGVQTTKAEQKSKFNEDYIIKFNVEQTFTPLLVVSVHKQMTNGRTMGAFCSGIRMW